MSEIEKYAQAPLELEGTFRAFPISWTVEESEKSDSQSVAVAIQFAIHQQWHKNDEGGGAWSEVWPAGYYCYNRTYVVKKNGEPNAGAFQALNKAKLWDGDWNKFEENPPSVFVIIDVEPNEYNGRVTYRAEWLHPNAEEPTPRQAGFKPTSPTLIGSLQQRFGSQFRAMAGGETTGTPPTPPTPGGATTPAQQEQKTAATPPAPTNAAPTPPTTPATTQTAPPAETQERPPMPQDTETTPKVDEEGVPFDQGEKPPF